MILNVKGREIHLCGRNRLVFVCVVVPCGRLLNTVVKDGAASHDFTDLSRFTDALYRFFFQTEGVHAVVLDFGSSMRIFIACKITEK